MRFKTRSSVELRAFAALKNGKLRQRLKANTILVACLTACIVLAPFAAAAVPGTGTGGTDSDGDGIPDAVEEQYGLDPNADDADLDKDEDSLANAAEIAAGTDPAEWDSDGDGLSDGYEAANSLNPLSADSDGDGFFDSEGVPGIVRWESWYELPAQAMYTMTENRAFPDRPDAVQCLPLFELKQSDPRVNHYGNRLRALFVPEETGEHTFWVAGHNQVLLLLSTDSSPLNAEVIAGGTRPTGEKDWFVHPEQQSEPVWLQAGQEYYLEIRHRHHERGDFFAVAMQAPGMTELQQMTADDLISFRRHPDDMNDNMLPDAWEEEHGLAGENGEPVRFKGDPDGDGLYNCEEAMLGSDPLAVNDQFRGIVSRKFWADIPALHPYILPVLESFPVSPYGHDILEKTETPIWWGELYGARIQGFVEAPETGMYNIFVCGRVSTQLWLSESESKFEKKLIASSADTHQRDWTRYESQNSGEIYLEQGRKYYFELNYAGHWGDHAGIGWQRPGVADVEIIGSEFIHYFYRDPDDLDNDDLPDSWEREHGLDPAAGTGDDGFHGDPDGDGLKNRFEWQNESSPKKADTDGDGLSDLMEFGIATEADDASEPVLAAIPPQWVLAETGEPEISEAAGLANGVGMVTQSDGFVESAAGSGTESFRDHLSFLHSKVSGNFELVAKLKMNPAQDPRFRAGLMFRESLDAGSDCTGIFSSPDQLFETIKRIPGNIKQVRNPAAAAANYDEIWLKLVRKGDTFYSCTSANGTSWQPYSYSTIDLAGTGLAGFALAGVNDFGQVFGCSFLEYTLRTDKDADGLFDDEEREAGTDPNSKDSDGDGVSDYDEKYEYYSDPTVADVSVSNARTIAPDSFASAVGELLVADGAAAFENGRGILRYSISIPEDGLYEIAVAGEVLKNNTPDTEYGVRVSVDNQYVKRLVYNITENNTPLTRKAILPWLNAGEFTIQLFLDNASVMRQFQFNKISLNKLSGTDSDADGRADWIENRLVTLNGFDKQEIVSHISPYCLEGRSRFRKMLSLNGAAGTASPAPAERWYKNIPLNESGITKVAAAFENGGLTRQVSIDWQPLDMARENIPVQHLRAGDTMRFGLDLEQSQRVQIQRCRVFNSAMRPIIRPHISRGGQPFQHTFSEPGTYCVTFFAVVKNDRRQFPRSKIVRNYAVVDVVDTAFPDSPVAIFGEDRHWVCEDFKGTELTELCIESDPRMLFDDGWQLQDGGYEFTMRLDAAEPRYLLARIGGPGGPIVDSTEIRPLHIQHNRDACIRYIDETEGGDTVVEMWMVVNEVYDDVEVEVNAWTGNVTLFDGSRKHRYAPEDFDELGICKVHLIKAATSSWHACNVVKCFQDGINLHEGK